MSLVLVEVHHKEPFLFISLISRVPRNMKIHETLDLVHSLPRPLIESELPFEASYHNFEPFLGGPSLSPYTINPGIPCIGDHNPTRTPPIAESL